MCLRNQLVREREQPNHSTSSDSITVSTSAVSVTEQSTIGPSTVIQAPSETTSRIGTNNIKTAGAVGVTVTETAAAAVPNISESQPADIIETESTPASLWDKAYDSLKQEQPELLSEYEDLLSRVLIKGSLDYSEPVPFAVLMTQYSSGELPISPRPGRRLQQCQESDPAA